MTDFILDPETSSGRHPNQVVQTLCQRHAELVSASQSFPQYAQSEKSGYDHQWTFVNRYSIQRFIKTKVAAMKSGF